MRLMDRIRIHASPTEIWAQVGDPEQWPGFHPKVVRVERRSGSGPVVDAWYDIEFEMNGKRLVHKARVSEVLPERRLCLAATVPLPREGESGEVQVDIVYELDPTATGVEVVETYEITGHGLPWFVRWIARFINRFGRPVGPSSLTQLKELLEPESSMAS